MPTVDLPKSSRRLNQVTVLGLVGCLLAGCQTASNVGVTGAPMAEPAPASLAGGNVTAPPRPAGDARSVVVPAYRVSFQQSVRVSATASPLLGRGVARTSQHTALVGIPPDTYQRIVDRAHADFLAKARAAGLLVRTEAPGIETAATVPNNTVPEANALAEGIMGRDGNVVRHVAPRGMRTFARQNDGQAYAFSSLDRALPDLAKRAGAPVGLVLFTVDFAATASSNQNVLGRMGARASVETTAQISLRESASGVRYQTPAGAGCVGYCPNMAGTAVNTPAVSAESFTRTTQNAMGGGETAVHALASGLGALGGMGVSVGANQIVADPAAYERIVGQLLEQANSRVVQALAGAG
jgi:hypothetical protein